MPKVNFGERISLDQGLKYLEVKAKNEKVRFQLIKGVAPVYDGKHFEQYKDGTWNVFYCPRVMRKAKCDFCEKYFELQKQAKLMKEQGKTAEEIDKVKQQARKFNASVTFYYAVINRDEEEAQVLRAKLSVRNKLDDFYNNGMDVFGCDFILTCTQKPGNDYYSLMRQDSAKTPAFTDKEQEELKKAENWDLEELVGIANESSQAETFESGSEEKEQPNSETSDEEIQENTGAMEEVNLDDIPF